MTGPGDEPWEVYTVTDNGRFVAASTAGVNPAWAAPGGALVLAGRALGRRETTAVAIARPRTCHSCCSCWPWG